ncbi:hypothetical protein ACQKPT_15375 [Pseudomonas monteilii]|uniref:hypothetical protein n=1 Tax=Pseudomonas monteilii TaxID=76759 RepID=UPI003D09439C
MPTENRSINTEMVSAPFQREERYVVIKVSKMHPHPTFRAKHLSALKREHEDALVDCVVVERDWPEYEPTWAAIEARVNGRPAPQPYPEPIAWMVGTAFWWTKEEAERDAAATGLSIVGLGPMADSADIDQLQLEIAELQLALTMHDDADIKDECIRAENLELHAKLAERNAPIIPELTSDLREILGRPNFTCHHIAKALRVMGLTIEPKSEDEQAVVIHWLLGHYLKHGGDWRQRAAAELEAASETMKA